MDFERFRSDFIKILPAVVAALLILGATIGYGIYRKWKDASDRPSYVPAPTDVEHLNPNLAPDPTGVAPIKQSEIQKPTDVPPLEAHPSSPSTEETPTTNEPVTESRPEPSLPQGAPEPPAGFAPAPLPEGSAPPPTGEEPL